MTTAEKIKVMQAFEDGKEVEFNNALIYGDRWIPVVGFEPNWDWRSLDYRIKPEPTDVFNPAFSCDLEATVKCDNVSISVDRYGVHAIKCDCGLNVSYFNEEYADWVFRCHCDRAMKQRMVEK